MTWRTRLLIAAPFAFLALPGTALAQDAAVAPFVANGVSAGIAANMTALASSEMDFMTEYDGAEELSAAPGMNTWCLDNAGCMVTIGRQAGADFLLGGMVSPAGADQFEIYMSLIDVNTGVFVRKQKFKVAASPEAMADNMGSFLSALVTGASHEQVAEAEAGATADEFDPFAEDDDFEFAAPTVSHTVSAPGNSVATLDDFEDDSELLRMEEEARRKRQEEQARREAEADAIRRAEEADRLARQEAAMRRVEEANRLAAEQERLRLEEEARVAAAEEERRRQEAAALAAASAARQREADAAARRASEEQRRRDEAAALAAASRSSGDDITFGQVNPDDIEVEDIQFGSAVDLISVDDADDGRTASNSYNSSSYEPASYGSDSRSGRSSSRSTADYDDPSRSSRSSRSTADYYDDLDDLDEPAVTSRDERGDRDKRSSRSSSYDGPSTEAAASKDGARSPLTVTARGGYSRYQSLGFVSYGGEIGIPLTKSMYLRMGAEAFSVKREIPVQYREIGGPEFTWETILPIGFGLSYQRMNDKVRPYVGGDLTITPYTADFKVAPGFRVRAGSDFMIVDNFGFNLNLGAGFWYGADLARVADNMSAAGLVPQISAGTVLAF